jgi:hypothetical protein
MVKEHTDLPEVDHPKRKKKERKNETKDNRQME